MIILLDENFPLALYTRLQKEGFQAEHTSIIWSQVTQSIPIEKRVEIWMRAISEFFSKKWDEKFFEVYDDGKLHPFEVIKT